MFSNMRKDVNPFVSCIFTHLNCAVQVTKTQLRFYSDPLSVAKAENKPTVETK